jgi:hypothetical protein
MLSITQLCAYDHRKSKLYRGMTYVNSPHGRSFFFYRYAAWFADHTMLSRDSEIRGVCWQQSIEKSSQSAACKKKSLFIRGCDNVA